MVSVSLSVYFRHGYTRNEVERRRDRRMVEKRAVLGHWWSISSLVRRVSRSPQSPSRYRHELHSHVKGFRRRRRLRGALLVQMDNASDSSHHAAHRKPRGSCRGILVCYQQWIPVVGTALW